VKLLHFVFFRVLHETWNYRNMAVLSGVFTYGFVLKYLSINVLRVDFLIVSSFDCLLAVDLIDLM